MGWSFRKSKSFGHIRLNLSKSGVGVSTGVKGARVSFGSRGTYVNLGRNGIYYRKKIGGGKTAHGGSTNRSNTNAVSTSYNYQQSEADYTTDAIKVLDNSSNSVLGQEIIKDIKRSRLFFWLWIIGSVILIYFLKEWGLALMPVSAILLWRFFNARLSFDLDNDAELEWRKFIETIYGLRESKKLWLVETASYNSNPKVNAGAYRNISRGVAKVKLVKANRSTGLSIKADVTTALINSNKCKILFIPSGVLIKKGDKLIAYSYDEINLSSSTTNFIEYGPIARDTEIVRRTWQFVNMDGTPDRRYKNNRQIPVCRYGTLDIRSNNLDVKLQTSNKLVTRNVDSSYQHYRGYVSRLESSNYISEIQLGKSVTSDTGASISLEERSLLFEMNDTIREAGRAYVDVLEKELLCKVTFVDGQLYEKHAILLYEAVNDVYERLDFIEHKLNANITYRNKITPVSEKEFLIHLYMDNLEGFNMELPLSCRLNTALTKSKTWKPSKQKEETTISDKYTSDDVNNILSSGASLFSRKTESNTTTAYDPYANLFDTMEDNIGKKEESSDKKTDVVDDLMGFFDEEES